jgi:Domain of unknown function (DUF4388)
MSLIGTLEEVRIADVLRLLAGGRKSGLLTVAAPGRQAVLHFQKGGLVHATAGRVQGEDAVLDLFGWKEGQLTFVPEERPVEPNLTRDVDSLILEGLRVGDSFHRMRELIPSDRVVFQLGPGPEDETARCSLDGRAWRVLRALDGIRDLREVADAARVPRAEVQRILFELASTGFLERVEIQKALRVQAQGLFGKEAAAAMDERFEQDWMKTVRFAHGVLRIEIRTLGGRLAVLPVTFRPGLFRDLQLPRSVLQDLGVREGEDVSVRPVA